MANIWQAVKDGNLAKVKELVTSGVKIDEREAVSNSTPLHYAAKQGKFEILNWLIKNGADINAKDGDGNTALLLSCVAKEESVCLFLIEHGAKPRLKNNKTEDVFDRAALISPTFLQKLTSTVSKLQQQSNSQIELMPNGIVISDAEFQKISETIERSNLGKIQSFYKNPKDNDELRQNWRVFAKYGFDEYIKKDDR